MSKVFLTYSPTRRPDGEPSDPATVTLWTDGWVSTTRVDGTTDWSPPATNEDEDEDD